jgi:hypothetical protein
MVGNGAYCSAGTNVNTAQWYEVASVSVGVSITFSTSNLGNSIATGVALGAAVTIGGCFATPGNAAAIASVAGQKIWAKYSTTAFTFTTSTAGAGGPALLANEVTLEGYDQVRGDRTGNQPQIAWPSTGITLGSATYALAIAGVTRIANISVNGNNLANACGLKLNQADSYAIQCSVKNCNGTGGIGVQVSALIHSCIISTCATGTIGAGTASYCTINSCATGVNNATAIHCVLNANATGFGTSNSFAINCTTDYESASPPTGAKAYNGITGCINSIASNYSGTSNVGFSGVFYMDTCAVYNNTTNVNLASVGTNANMITLTAQPYVTAGSQFAPNTTAGGGASLRGAAIGVSGQTDNCDGGAVQHEDPVGGTYIFQVES